MNGKSDVHEMVSDAVRNVRDRFGADGLRDLVTLATHELRQAEHTAERLAAQAEPNDIGDTQAWMAFTDKELDR